MSGTVKDVMTAEVVAVRRDTTFKELAATLRQYRVSAFPVVDDAGRVTGLVSEADMLAKEALAEPGDPRQFTVTVEAGVVTLAGTPETAALGRDLVRKARHVPGVVAVQDHLSYPDDYPVVATNETR
jgi:CBS domain-containing protein